MELDELRRMIAMDRIREGILKPGHDGNGWLVALEDNEGHQLPLTQPGGQEKIYHSLDNATAVLHELGISRISIVERF
ncbi:hypothetical protein [Marinobacterium arenosum]|uniref:hypothetical protein n=1 Tax=Marinobacterium arenosum TaxID=2862496 RepID=UPI001C96540D|nr:hypothetical protein [Marinobacterium arenosum]MBY4678700.1 hypothetical protein [Marinobacterium arenosum]